jgi:8-oxo-dGTP pyrophosphatase MutT (NUDIX family)
VSVKPPAVPSPAATLVLLRDRTESAADRTGGAVETLLIQRHAGSRFAGGDFVFPGGKVEADDCPADAVAFCPGLDEAAAARRLGLPPAGTALGFWVGAIREAFEEVGVLLAYDAAGRMVGPDVERLGDWRRACHADHRVFWTMLREEKLVLATDTMRYFAHWITPEERPIRFDTFFFAAPMPPGQAAAADGTEIVGLRWLTPAGARAARERGEISLRVPTQRNLAIFEGARSVSDALARLTEDDVPTIRPRLIERDGAARSLLPGDPGWY